MTGGLGGEQKYLYAVAGPDVESGLRRERLMGDEVGTLSKEQLTRLAQYFDEKVT